MRIDELKSKLREHKDIFYKRFGVVTIGIIGSYARGDYSDESDVDILVEFDKPIGLDFVPLADDLERLLQKKVDLVSKKAIRSRLMKFIEEDIIYV